MIDESEDQSVLLFSTLGKCIVDIYKTCFEEIGYDLGKTNNEIEYHNFLIEEPIEFYGSVATFPDDPDAYLRTPFRKTTVEASAVCKKCYEAFISIGCTDACAKGILANIAQESSFNPDLVVWDGSKKAGIFGVGGGICSFYFNGELKNLAAFCGWDARKLASYNNAVRMSGLPYPTTPCHSANSRHIKEKFGGFPFTLEQQIGFVCSCINKRYSAMKNMTSPGDAALYFMRHFERPAYEENRWYKHGAWVLKLLESK